MFVRLSVCLFGSAHLAVSLCVSLRSRCAPPASFAGPSAELTRGVGPRSWNKSRQEMLESIAYRRDNLVLEHMRGKAY